MVSLISVILSELQAVIFGPLEVTGLKNFGQLFVFYLHVPSPEIFWVLPNR